MSLLWIFIHAKLDIYWILWCFNIFIFGGGGCWGEEDGGWGGGGYEPILDYKIWGGLVGYVAKGTISDLGVVSNMHE